MNRGRPFVNRILKQKQLELTDIYHDHNMKEIKPLTAKFMEHTETITINHSKREKLKEAREMEIQRENKLLLEKISNVITKKGNYSVSKTKTISLRSNRSLNETARKRQLESIQLQNKQLFNRLNSKRTTLNTLKFKKDWEDSRSLIKRMENSQFNLVYFKYKQTGSKPKKIYKTLAEKIESLNISHFKVIDGHKMLIKIIFIDGFLHIIGDGAGKKDLKLIKIPKDQALTLIQSTCQGKIQNLVEKLRYDNESQTLYITHEDKEESQQNPQKKTNRKMNNKFQSLTHRVNKSSLENTPSTNKSQNPNLFNAVDSKQLQKINTTARKYEKLLRQQPKPTQQQQYEEQYQEQPFEEAKQQEKSPETREPQKTSNERLQNKKEQKENKPSVKQKEVEEVYQQDYNQDFQQEQASPLNA